MALPLDTVLRGQNGKDYPISAFLDKSTEIKPTGVGAIEDKKIDSGLAPRPTTPWTLGEFALALREALFLKKRTGSQKTEECDCTINKGEHCIKKTAVAGNRPKCLTMILIPHIIGRRTGFAPHDDSIVVVENCPKENPQPGRTSGHETGHALGHKGDLKDDPSHSSNPKDLMAPQQHEPADTSEFIEDIFTPLFKGTNVKETAKTRPGRQVQKTCYRPTDNRFFAPKGSWEETQKKIIRYWNVIKTAKDNIEFLKTQKQTEAIKKQIAQEEKILKEAREAMEKEIKARYSCD